MAPQAGPLRFNGQLGGLSFYHNRQYGYLVRQKGGPDKEEVAKSPRFARTRENAAEFALASAAGKLIRQAIRAATRLKGDLNVSQRLVGTLVRIGKNDLSAVRGARIRSQYLTMQPHGHSFARLLFIKTGRSQWFTRNKSTVIRRQVLLFSRALYQANLSTHRKVLRMYG